MSNVDPRILLLGIDKNADNLMRKIIEESGRPLTDNTLSENMLVERLWQIENKYYSANVVLSGFQFDSFNSEVKRPTFDRVEVIVAYLNYDIENIANALLTLKQYCNQYNVDIKLLVCDKFEQHSKLSEQLKFWCIDNDYELIELVSVEANEKVNKEEVTINLDDNDLTPVSDDVETHGVKRVIEALQVHVWPNAEMHSNKKSPSTNSSSKQTVSEEQQVDEFFELYAQLNAIKQSIEAMPRSAQLHHAEHVLNKFWNVIGGDSDELSDCSD